MALCLAVFLTYVNQTALLPVIPLYVRELGGTELIAGAALASFSVASFVLRPYIGRLVDIWGAGRVLLIGCAGLGMFTLGLSVPIIAFLFIANTMRGVAWAGINTGSNALLAGLAPSSRRGEASGYYSLFQAAAATVGPAVALYWLATTDNYMALFSACALCAFLALLISRPLQRLTDAGGRRRSGAHPPLIDRGALLPSSLLVFVMFTQPAVLGFLPLYAEEIGVSTAAVTGFYVVSGISALLGRALLGPVSDRRSRGAALLAGFALMGLALLGLLQATVVAFLLTVAALYSLGQGLALPALTALAIDRADQSRLGAAMATYSAAFQIGMGAGGLVSGFVISQAGYVPLYLLMGMVVALGALLTVVRWADLGGGRVAP